MTIPGIEELILILIVSVGTFIDWFRSPRPLLSMFAVGCACVIAGLLIISMHWTSPSISDILHFRPQDFYIGIPLFSLGVGLTLGNTFAWFVSRVHRLF